MAYDEAFLVFGIKVNNPADADPILATLPIVHFRGRDLHPERLRPAHFNDGAYTVVGYELAAQLEESVAARVGPLRGSPTIYRQIPGVPPPTYQPPLDLGMATVDLETLAAVVAACQEALPSGELLLLCQGS